MKQQFADERRTTIEESEFEHDIEDLIQREDMVVTVTQRLRETRSSLDLSSPMAWWKRTVRDGNARRRFRGSGFCC